MKFIDWFAGVGGFRRGMELAGHECVGFCEFDKYAVASYTAMHLCTPEQIDYLKTLPLKERQKEIAKDEYRNGEWYANDIREVRGWSVPKADCWCFGAPCQDFSSSGNRSGLKGDRSSLVKEIFRILGEMQEEDRPEWLLYENVKGMLSSNNGFDFLAILLEMDGGGYDVQWQVLNSRDFGVPQSRDRVYTIGHLRQRGRSEVLPIGATDEKNFITGNTPIIIDDFYTSRPIRVYDKYSPTLRSDRNGLKVLSNVDYGMIGYNATRNEGGYNGHRPYFNGEGLQRTWQSNDDDRSNVFSQMKILKIFDSYDKRWTGRSDYVGTITANSYTSVTHCGTYLILQSLEDIKGGANE